MLNRQEPSRSGF